MQKNPRFDIRFLAVFLLSLSLRLALVGINREANDPHWDVADHIIQSGSLPLKADCWECFQPKLFHVIFAESLRLFALTQIPPYRQNILGEIINFIAGVITLAVVWKFIKRLPVHSDNLRLIAFVLIALNPPLIGINSQATNDSFAILFSTLALYFAYEFLQKYKVKTFLLILLFVLLGISSKTNDWVTAIAIGIALLIKVWMQPQQRLKALGYAVIFMIATIILSVLNPLNQYVTNYREYGTPIVVNLAKQPLPYWSKPTQYANPGILSIQDGFLTFKLIELLRHPRLETSTQGYPSFRTSFWTLLYGRAHSIHFDNWPPPWSTSGNTLFSFNRGIIVLALIPTFLLILGAVLEMSLVFRSIIRHDAFLGDATAYGLFAMVFVGYILFLALFALEYRDYFLIKAIFIYPALLAFPYLFLKAGERMYLFFSTRFRWIKQIFEAAIGLLLVFYVVDVTTLIIQLVQTYLRSHGD